jgi:SAM-dependent methyltransferase
VATEKINDFARSQELPIQAIVCDAMDIDKMEPFDFVIGTMILHHVEPFEDFCTVLHRALRPGGRAFFYENNGANRVLMWCRQNVAGRFGIPKYGDAEEFPLTPREVDLLRGHFNVVQDFPENSFFTLVSVYLFRRRGYRACKRLDAFLMRRKMMRSYAYRQILMLEKAR